MTAIRRIDIRPAVLVVTAVVAGLAAAFLVVHLRFGSLKAMRAYLNGAAVLVETTAPPRLEAEFGSEVEIPCVLTNLTSSDLRLEGVLVNVPYGRDLRLPATVPAYGSLTIKFRVIASAVRAEPDLPCTIQFYINLGGSPDPQVSTVIAVQNAPASLPVTCGPRS